MTFKKIFIILVAACVACTPEDAVPTTPVSTNLDTTGYALVKLGILTGQAGHTASGVASILTKGGNYAVVLDPYTSQNGPDLKVYLSKDEAASQYIRLGNLQSTVGRQVYAVPAGTDVATYTYVHIWCEKYTVEFARAQLN